MDSDLTLAKAIQKVRQCETVKRQQVILHSEAVGGDPKTNVDAIKTNMKKGKKFQRSGQKINKDRKSDAQGEKECRRCRQGRKHGQKDCPAKDAECRKCHKRGHCAVACQNGKLHTVTQGESDCEPEDYAFLGEVDSQTTTPWMEKVNLNGEAVTFKIDTGVDVTSVQNTSSSLRGMVSWKNHIKDCSDQAAIYCRPTSNRGHGTGTQG